MFLNKDRYKEELARIFEEAKKEVVLVVPYIRMSKEVFSNVKTANDKGIEILIICKTDGVKPQELKKLQQLDRISVMAHPNLHSKIYLNEENIIVGSMNLYDHSEFFNREAGYMIEEWDEESWESCLQEISEIKSGAELLFASKKFTQNNLDFELIKTSMDAAYDYAEKLNKLFKTKTFRVLESKEGMEPSCMNFYDGIDVVISNRIAIFPRYPKPIMDDLFKRFINIPENHFHPFRTYCSDYHQNFTIYAPKGKYIDEEIHNNPKFAHKIEEVTIGLCKLIDAFYKKEFKKMQRA